MGCSEAFHLQAAIRRCTLGRVTNAQFPLYSAQISFGQPVAQYLLCAARTGRSSQDGGTCLAFPVFSHYVIDCCQILYISDSYEPSVKTFGVAALLYERFRSRPRQIFRGL
jgi:hypothetical protein